MTDTQFPPLPTLKRYTVPPATSEPITFTSKERLNLYAISDDSQWEEWVSEIPMTRIPISPGVLVNFWEGVKLPSYTLHLSSYWVQVPGSYAVVYPGDTYTRSVTEKHGLSETDSKTISAELGVEFKGLSAKISATFEQSVTVSSEASVSKTYSVKAPETGARVWVLWQLVNQIAALDDKGNVITSDGLGRGDVSWDANNSSGRVSGAYLNYPSPMMDMPSDLFMPQQADFPA